MATNLEIPEQVERLDELIDQLHLDGCLSDPEMAELESILLDDSSAQKWFYLKQEFHTMLSVDNSIRLELANDLLPEKDFNKRGSTERPELSRLEEVNQSFRKTGRRDQYGMAISLVAMVSGLLVLLWLFTMAKDFSPTPTASVGEEQVSFADQIYPIFVDHCLSCHGEDEVSREADLRLDQSKSAIGSERPVIVPGKPEESELIARIQSEETDYQMPPRGEKESLNASQVRLISKWIEQGANYKSTAN